MNKVLNITNRLEDKKRKQQIEAHRHKVETVQKIVQCASCHFRCAMCGYNLDAIDSSHPPVPSPAGFYLCEKCRAEFEDFSKMVRGKKGSEVFWHNKEWMNLWSAWLDYQQAIGEFKKSVEFKQITKKPNL